MSLFFRATSGLIQPTGSGPPPGDLELEEVNNLLPAADRITNTVATTPRQAWHGFGWGLGDAAYDVRTLIDANKEQLFADLNTKVMRINHPGKPGQSTVGKGTVDIGVENGVDTVLSTGYLWRIQNDGTPTYSATTMASEIDALMDGGMLITHATIQNEPDGNDNNPPTPETPSSVIPVLNAAYNELRDELDARGRSSVKLYGCEWAHNSGSAQLSEQEYDTLNAASMIPMWSPSAAGIIITIARPTLNTTTVG